MKRFKNHLIAAAVLSVLAIVGTIMNSHQAKAQGPPNGLAVNIVNPVPLPVTGSTSVSGTVAATQSGTWNVGITGNSKTDPLFTHEAAGFEPVNFVTGAPQSPTFGTALPTISIPYPPEGCS
jgi:hypothetical protein